MSTSKDITKISELRTKDDGDWDEWPYPTITITSKVTGELRGRILAKLGQPGVWTGEVTLIETDVSAGYSEYTQEDDCEIEVQIGGARAWHSEYHCSTDSAMAAFLKWLDA